MIIFLSFHPLTLLFSLIFFFLSGQSHPLPLVKTSAKYITLRGCTGDIQHFICHPDIHKAPFLYKIHWQQNITWTDKLAFIYLVSCEYSCISSTELIFWFITCAFWHPAKDATFYRMGITYFSSSLKIKRLSFSSPDIEKHPTFFWAPHNSTQLPSSSIYQPHLHSLTWGYPVLYSHQPRSPHALHCSTPLPLENYPPVLFL